MSTNALPVGSKNERGKIICGALRHNGGGYCNNTPMKNGRCKLHGGRDKITGPPKGGCFKALTANLYSKNMDEEEKDLYQTLEVGSLEQEIRLLRIHLRRALQAQDNYTAYKEQLSRELENDVSPDGMHIHLEIDSYEKYVDGNDIGRKIIRRKRDYSKEISSLLNSIGRLETRHNDLMTRDIPDSERIAQISRDLREFNTSVDDTVPEE